LADVLREWTRLDALLPADFKARALVRGDGDPVRDFVGPEAVQHLARFLGVESKMELPGAAPSDRRRGFLADERQRRQVKGLEDHVQHLLRGADRARNASFLDHTTLIRTLAPRGERFRMFRVKEQAAAGFTRQVEP